MAEAIRKQRISKINTDDSGHVSYPEIGKNWVSHFLKRHPQLKTVRGRSIERSRIRESSPEIINMWFDGYKLKINELNALPKNTYNMDETGFTIGDMQSSNIIIDKDACTKLQASPGCQEWISTIES